MVSALQRKTTAELPGIAAAVGVSERTLWRYRGGQNVPSRIRLARREEILGIRRAVDEPR